MLQTTLANPSPFSTRPKTLAEAVARVNAGESYDLRLAEFLDTFYALVRAGDLDGALSAIDAEPPRMADQVRHAFIGGMAEHLARRWSLPRIPAWTNHPSRFLHEPVFDLSSPSVRAIYLVESPIAFRRRLIFTEAVPLRRASMPVTA